MTVKLTSPKCPVCGAELELEQIKTQGNCPYCGAEVFARNENEYIFLFNLANTQIYMRTVILNENGVAKKMTSRKPVYPDSWKNQFGLPVEEHKQAISINKIDDYIVIGIQDPKKKHAASETTTE